MTPNGSQAHLLGRVYDKLANAIKAVQWGAFDLARDLFAEADFGADLLLAERIPYPELET